MKNIPTITQESEEERALREAERQKQYPTGLNLIYQDFLKELEGWEASHVQLGRDHLLFLYRLGDNTDAFFEEANEEISEENRNHRERLFQAACKRRNHSADLAIILGCRREQIANSPEEITKDSRAYIGVLEPGIFEKLPRTVDYIYTAFPEERILIDKDVVYGGKTRETIREELRNQKIRMTIGSEVLLDEFLENIKQKSVDVIRLSGRSMGFRYKTTRQEIYDQAKELGLKVNIPSELGPVMRLRDRNQERYEDYLIGMRPMKIFNDGSVFVFFVRCDGDGSHRLDFEGGIDSDSCWDPDFVWAFIRK